MSRSRAFTLLEVIVAGVICLVLFGLFFALLVPALRNTSNRSARAELGQAAATTMMRLTAELKATLASTIKVYPTGLVLTRLGDLTSDGRNQYVDYLTVVAFEQDARVLTLGRWKPASADPNTWIPAPAEFSTVASALSQRKQLTAHVEEFQVTLGVPVAIHLVLVRKVSTDAPERLEMDTRVCLRNAL